MSTFSVKQMNVIYKLTFPNNKSYIGLTKRGFDARFRQHVTNAHRNVDGCVLVERAIRKYGENNIKKEILATSETKEELSALEIKFIAEHKTLHPDGYNISKGGDGNSIKHTFENKTKTCERSRTKCMDMEREMYVKYYKTNFGTEGFKVCVPGFKTAQFCLPNLTMEQKLELANEHARALARGEIIEVNRYRQKDLGYENTPKGFSYIGHCDGFRVSIKGKPDKTFKSKSLTRDQKYQLALKYYNEQTTQLNGRMLAGDDK